MMGDGLDDVLNRRVTPAAPSNLAQRIIDAAAEVEKKPSHASVWDKIGPLFAVPKPAFAVAFALVLALWLGFMADGQNAVQDTDEINAEELVSAWLYYEEDWL